MKLFHKKEALSDYLAQARSESKRIGLVPTMGALHEGHLSLLGYIKNHCDIRVCSVFVNPTQFNNKEDLEKYPRPINEDLKLLEKHGCDVVFMPEVDEMYGENEDWKIDLGNLDRVLEGAFRPGHYQGVTQIVKKLFNAVMPDVVCFGQKDYQQFLVIKKMVEICLLKVELLLCPTIREENGLAMSSRNVRLTKEGKKQASAIYRILKALPENYVRFGYVQARAQAIQQLENVEEFKLEYFEICETETLSAVQARDDDDNDNEKLVALVAVWLEDVRLIDNIIF